MPSNTTEKERFRDPRPQKTGPPGAHLMEALEKPYSNTITLNLVV
ncbi:MAG: hypothetical protein U0236_07440 [Nitrospira sp.]